MGNRKRPFGYEMENGTVILHSQEAEMVSAIFERYIHGESYQALTLWLNEQPIAYVNGKPWNMNMVARIVCDERYTGIGGYAAIISREQFNLAYAKRGNNTSVCRLTETQKALRRLSGRRLTESEERQVIERLHRLIHHPDMIQPVQQIPSNHMEISTIQKELEQLMEQQPLPEGDAVDCALRLASARFDCLGDSEYETERIRSVLENVADHPLSDAEILRETISRIRIGKDGGLEIELKNHQIIRANEKI